MGQATLGPVEFRLDPNEISWGFSVRTSVTNTVGGRVIQVLGTKVSSMKVVGSTGIGGYTEHRALVKKLVAVAESHVDGGGTPVKFRYPPRDLEFDVFIRAINGGNGAATSSITPGKVNHEFTLDLFLASNNSELNRIATDLFIARFAEGIGWTPNEFNGEASYADYIQSLADLADAQGPQNATAERSGQTEDDPAIEGPD